MVMGCRVLGVMRGGGTGGALLSSGLPLKIWRVRQKDVFSRFSWSHLPILKSGGGQSTFLCSSIRISTTIFWNLMSNMAATVSTWALISVGPKITAMLEGVMRLSSLWPQTLWTDTGLSSWGQRRCSWRLQPVMVTLTWPSALWASQASPGSSLVTCRWARGFHSVENPDYPTLQHINVLSNQLTITRQ